MKADIQLVDSQEIKIREYLDIYYKGRQSFSMASGKKEKIQQKKADYQNYCALRDAVLTVEQKTQLRKKAEERKEAGKIKMQN